MMDRGEMSQELDPARDLILRVCGEHEAAKHGGNPCWANRASAVAWICHSLGIHNKTPLWDYVGEQLADYDANCDKDCHPKKHPENET